MKLTPAKATSIDTWPGPGVGRARSTISVALASRAGAAISRTRMAPILTGCRRNAELAPQTLSTRAHAGRHSPRRRTSAGTALSSLVGAHADDHVVSDEDPVAGRPRPMIASGETAADTHC